MCISFYYFRHGELRINDQGQAADIPQGEAPLLAAARAYGAASDKGGKVTVDAIVYMNKFLNLTAPGNHDLLPNDPECVEFRKEVLGEPGTWVEECFLIYSSFGYSRSTNFGALPRPAYIGDPSPTEGTFEYLKYIEPTTDPFKFEVVQEPIIAGAFNNEDVGNPTPIADIGAFVQAADDARAVINHMHNWPG